MATITVLDATLSPQTCARVTNTGQTTMTNSLPITIASDQTAIPVSGPVAEDAQTTTAPVIVGGVVRTAAAPTTLIAGDVSRDTMTLAGAKTVAIGAPVVSAEVGSAARTATGNSGVISVPTGGAISGNIVCSTFSGTAPTLDITLEESYDNGSTWQQIWAAPRITATASIPIPQMTIGGLRRWVWTLGGTSPSFTFAINTNQLASPAPIIRKMMDRTAGVLSGTFSAVTAALPVAGLSKITAKISLAAAATGATYQMQLSDDNVSWSNVGTATVAVANNVTTISVPAGICADWARVICTSAGTGQTGNYVSLQAAT